MRLLDNPHHKDELWRLGVRPATAFACGIDFLLRIRPQALAPHHAALEVTFPPAHVCRTHTAHARGTLPCCVELTSMCTCMCDPQLMLQPWSA
jgi:hypothetical protein